MHFVLKMPCTATPTSFPTPRSCRMGMTIFTPSLIETFCPEILTTLKLGSIYVSRIAQVRNMTQYACTGIKMHKTKLLILRSTFFYRLSGMTQLTRKFPIAHFKEFPGTNSLTSPPKDAKENLLLNLFRQG